MECDHPISDITFTQVGHGMEDSEGGWILIRLRCACGKEGTVEPTPPHGTEVIWK